MRKASVAQPSGSDDGKFFERVLAVRLLGALERVVAR